MGSNNKEIRDGGEGTSGVKKLDDGFEHELSNGLSDLMGQDSPGVATASEPFPAPMVAPPVSTMTVPTSPGLPAPTRLLQNREVLQRVGQIFVAVKTLPVGIYHYRFIVDGFFTYAPEFPWAFDDSGYAYNILDLQDYIPESHAKLPDFESPPSPPWSYDNILLNDEEFDKPPPELPPQMPVTVRDEPSSSTDIHQRFPRPTHLELNHLYIHKTEGEPFVALRSTSRFQLKYVTTLLYRSLTRER
ncbi:SNF1-related protein kinase regulatory subunit beta-2 isoform X2 [Neltuma alba]|uniref:SNF1-related protein kinase regulatory subunit beta-2 isoform X2 n=1 Tax=Neltuma alba TaxID=207710 RepID=UPI0010A593D5|nr:SNF1-related protein kinase regulatory subunit beta-2-like isoform X2 [Prosopis alba]